MFLIERKRREWKLSYLRRRIQPFGNVESLPMYVRYQDQSRHVSLCLEEKEIKTNLIKKYWKNNLVMWEGQILERQRDRETERQRDRGTEKDRERQRKTEKDRERQVRIQSWLTWNVSLWSYSRRSNSNKRILSKKKQKQNPLRVCQPEKTTDVLKQQTGRKKQNKILHQEWEQSHSRIWVCS